MAIKYMLDEDARDQLDQRIGSGLEALQTYDDYVTEERETVARDVVSNILTALFGPAGYCVEQPNPRTTGSWNVVLDGEKVGLAGTFLDMALESWQGDAEDYTATAVTVDNPLLAEDGPKLKVAESAKNAILARYLDVEREYKDTVIPGESDNSVLEAERDTLEWVLSQLNSE